MDRRSFLRLGVAVAALGAIGAPAVASGAVQSMFTGEPVVDPSAAVGESLPEPLRYLFRCSSLDRPLRDFTRLDAVWAYTGYLRIASCQVEYIGDGPHELTLEEDAVVQVAEDLGEVVTDRTATYMTILAACTRIHPSVLDETLNGLGVPLVTAALALAPQAPQVKQFQAWLGIDPAEEPAP